MDGVTILSIEEITEAASWITPALISVYLFIIVAHSIYIIANKDDLLDVLITVIVGVYVMLLAYIVLGSIFQVPTGKYKYNVIIDNNVSVVEFYEQYEIVNQNGTLYTIKDR